jgi:hypothetical protein
MAISSNGSRPSMQGPAEHFTGTVRIDPLFLASAPGRAGGAFGCSLHQSWGGPIEEIRPGDVVTVGPGEKHWHGASPTTAMTHIAIQESLEGRAVDWPEKVDDATYRGKP